MTANGQQGEERVEITLRDVYDSQQQLTALTGSLGTQLTSLNARFEERHQESSRRADDHENRLRVIEQSPKVPDDHEGRIRALEKFRFTLVGAIIVINGALVLAEWVLFVHK
jgi:hypothetical protein